MRAKVKVEFGDFQTPLALARQVCALLAQRGVIPDVVVEPTCGIGSFLIAAAETFSEARLLGWEINDEYAQQSRQALKEVGAAARSTVATRDFFKHDWKTEFVVFQGKLLIIGNLPWVTNSAMSSLDSANLPEKRNLHGFRGMEALTGKSNFDISEWMLIELTRCLRGTSATIAMLCKTATARKLLRFAWQNGRIAEASIHRIDAKKHFDVAVDACLLLVQTGSPGPSEAPVFDDMEAKTPSKFVGLAGQDLVSDVRAYQKLRHLEGLCPYQWRSGIKHDCSAVMELWREAKNRLRNKLNETIELEPDFVFPLLKCSDLANGRSEPNRCVLVTQRRVGEDTSGIAKIAPRAWNYLESHRKRFEARKSSIYASRIPFALFGIGEYSFAPWKVAISGLHKTPQFVAVGPCQSRPVFFDDTCYFLPFQNEDEAKVVVHILNSEPCLRFISSLLFDDSKRPVTVELLQRLNLSAIAEDANLGEEWAAVRHQQSFHPNERGGRQAEFLMS